jgi:hypothetical protein
LCAYFHPPYHSAQQPYNSLVPYAFLAEAPIAWSAVVSGGKWRMTGASWRPGLLGCAPAGVSANENPSPSAEILSGLRKVLRKFMAWIAFAEIR